MCHLNSNELLFQGFSIMELLPKAHVDAVVRGAAIILFKLP